MYAYVYGHDHRTCAHDRGTAQSPWNSTRCVRNGATAACLALHALLCDALNARMLPPSPPLPSPPLSLRSSQPPFPRPLPPPPSPRVVFGAAWAWVTRGVNQSHNTCITVQWDVDVAQVEVRERVGGRTA